MANFLSNLRLSIQSLGLSSIKPKLSLRLSQSHAQAVQPEAEQHLQHIIQQVRAEGFYVETLSVFCYDNLKPGESISAIERWAAEVGLKVSFNHEHQLCFFESL